ncbi:glycoside hydrolase family 18 protein [Alloacidobacterium dinghuense]|uniref:chitinase n=1 Tax=Alloacidobacterium dinghuense TaxID=2763107 RepID=A0A7G8BEQ5_9BACT|nr:glycoside hydrolase family 18 protein [Alloacidobacterium dinghuense]QNI31025.1 glycoside hydrolase family 18 protein [Alloacidobacterium dinghuense]
MRRFTFSSLLLLSILLSGLNLFGETANPAKPLLVGYFPQWGIYNDPPYFVKDLITSGSATLLDQLNYAQGFIVNARCAVADPNADLSLAYTKANSVNGKADSASSQLRGSFHQLQEFKKRYPRIKILISLEGKAHSFAEAAKPENRAAFVSSCIDTFMRGHFAPQIHARGIFDGFDVDWEYPEPEDAANYLALLQEFRKQLDAVRPGLKLTIAAGPSPHMYHGVDFGEVAKVVDEIGLMNYDYSGPWRKVTGFHAPLYSENGGSADRTVQDYEDAGAPPEKLLLGVPFYGYSWNSVGEENHGLFQPGEAVHQDRPYRYIQTLIASSTVYRDPAAQAPWLYDGNTFWTYEDPASARFKGEYAQEHGLGGVMVWELGEDSIDAQLLKAVNAGLRLPAAQPQIAREPVISGGSESTGAAKE